MSDPFFYGLLSVLVVSLIAFVGVFTLSLSHRKLEKVLIYMISFAAGGLLGDVFLHILPEISHNGGFGLKAGYYLLLGIAVSFIMEKIIRWRHCHHVTCDSHPHPYAKMNLLGDVVHNFIDGLIIGAAYIVSVPVGLATTVAVVFHEIPQEIGDMGVLLHGGYSRGRALFLNFVTALTAFLGLFFAFGLSSGIEGFAAFLMPFAAGNFIYIAVADLIPEMHKEVGVSRSVKQLISFVFGIALMAGVLLLPFHSHGVEEELDNHDNDHNVEEIVEIFDGK